MMMAQEDDHLQNKPLPPLPLFPHRPMPLLHRAGEKNKPLPLEPGEPGLQELRHHEVVEHKPCPRSQDPDCNHLQKLKYFFGLSFTQPREQVFPVTYPSPILSFLRTRPILKDEIDEWSPVKTCVWLRTFILNSEAAASCREALGPEGLKGLKLEPGSRHVIHQAFGFLWNFSIAHGIPKSGIDDLNDLNDQIQWLKSREIDLRQGEDMLKIWMCLSCLLRDKVRKVSQCDDQRLDAIMRRGLSAICLMLCTREEDALIRLLEEYYDGKNNETVPAHSQNFFLEAYRKWSHQMRLQKVGSIDPSQLEVI